jgi:hypothetical protein
MHPDMASFKMDAFARMESCLLIFFTFRFGKPLDKLAEEPVTSSAHAQRLAEGKP